MGGGFLDFYDGLGEDVSDVSIWYDFDTGNYTLPPEGLFNSGDSSSPLIQNKAGNSGNSAVGENLEDFYLANGSGTFEKNSQGSSFLKIRDSDQLSENSWTMLMTTRKEGKRECVLFSSLSGDKGFAFGLNAANNFYFQSPTQVFVSDLNYASYNGIFASKNGSSFNIGRYNFDDGKFDKEGFSFTGVSHGDDWFLGGTPNPSISEPDFSGVIDNFVYFNRRINIPTLSRAFSGFMAEDGGSLGSLTLTGIETFESGYVESGIRHMSTGSRELNGSFSIIKDSFSVTSDIRQIGTINDFCGNIKPFFQMDEMFGVKEGGRFLQYDGAFSESNEVSGSYTGSNVVVREMVTGFDQQESLTTGSFPEVNFEFNCINECGNVEPIFSFRDRTGIVSGFNFIPLTGLVSGSLSTRVEDKIEMTLYVDDVQGGDCGFQLDESYVDQYGFDGALVNQPLADSSRVDIATSESNLNLNNVAPYNRSNKFFGVPKEYLNGGLMVFLDGKFQISGQDYGFFSDRGISGSSFTSSGNVTYSNIPDLSVANVPSGSYSTTHETSFIFTGEDHLLHFIARGIASPLDLPSDSIVARTNEPFGLGSGPSNLIGSNFFLEGDAFMFLDGRKLNRGSDYLESSDNDNFGSGIMKTLGEDLGGGIYIQSNEVLSFDTILFNGGNLILGGEFLGASNTGLV